MPSGGRMTAARLRLGRALPLVGALGLRLADQDKGGRAAVLSAGNGRAIKPLRSLVEHLGVHGVVWIFDDFKPVLGDLPARSGFFQQIGHSFLSVAVLHATRPSRPGPTGACAIRGASPGSTNPLRGAADTCPSPYSRSRCPTALPSHASPQNKKPGSLLRLRACVIARASLA